MSPAIYLDCHSTTPVDPEVLEAMLPWFTEHFGNAGSHSHRWGEAAGEIVHQSRQTIAELIGARADEIVFTSGATESNNLAILGVAGKRRRQRPKLLSLEIEHPSVIEPLQRLAKQECQVQWLPVAGPDPTETGQLNLDALKNALDQEVALVTLAVANNEIGVLQRIPEIARRVHEVGAWLHVDASQAVGWEQINVQQWEADLISLSAHKFYGPKGMGALFVRSEARYETARPVRLLPQAVGGGQEHGLRSGTINVPGIVGMARAMALAFEKRETASVTVADLRDQLWQRLKQTGRVQLNGPALNRNLRLPNNLNFRIEGIEGQSLMALVPHLGMSSGSACSSAEPGVSTVLTGIGLTEDQARCSLRIGLGRMHDVATIQQAGDDLAAAIQCLPGP